MKTLISPFSEEQLENIKNLINPLNEIQLAWISGYLAGRSQLPLPQQNGKAAEVPVADQVNHKLTILYGSRTGNGKGLAKMTEKMAADIGLPVEVKSMEDYQPKELVNEKYLLIIVSTHGDGVPPFQAKVVYDHLHGKRAQRLDETQYAVLALGDSSYFHFCKTGKDFDSKLEALGAKRIREILCCDVDYKQSDEVWIQETLADFKRLTGSGNAETTVKPAGVKTEKSVRFTKQKPYAAQVFEKINLHGRGSERATLHIELQADVAGLSYEPGDSAGIIPVNAKELITELLQVTALNPDETIEINGIKRKLEEALYRDLELSKITPDVIKRYLEQFPDNKLEAVYKDQQALQTYIYGRDIVDLLTDYPVKLTAAQLVSILKPLQPRYYSIASSPNAYPGEIHLTVALVDYEQGGRNKRGTCTGFLSDVLEEDEHVPVFIESNPNFRLPANPATPIIMIGAGTGVAPYRAFVQERALNPGSGKSWLFFGNRHFETEFLYQTEWQQHLKSGALTRMDVAFSRDGEKPVYVQHRLLEQAGDIYQWIQNGAYIYICGDMKKMAVDVQNALSTILSQEGGYNADEAQEYLNRMQQEKRLQLDVY
ncbi:Sulfite reductase [NADPH] flavoprotein alpha-component [bioreactor metagenome]|uniref:Sulfite reductase [NADPH] flavoprotein alpha-component n=1 Tax=bioreactor metagenome TaxID=1076179 RepID=A0A644W197_9ZZZZ|nr:assimilatory sulfite reductase (NADPH) flavoprotein subunit [Paludibacter sp.]